MFQCLFDVICVCTMLPIPPAKIFDPFFIEGVAFFGHFEIYV